MKRILTTVLFTFSPFLFTFGSGLAFDAGADLRIRQELMGNVPGLPGGGLVKTPCGKFKDHVRFRPRVWAELKGDTEDFGKWRLFARIGDEFRWNIEPKNNATSWPGELYLDNLFLEGKGLFDGFLDLKIGRQDLWGYCGLDHIFVDGTPGDGSRSIYSDMAALKFHVDEDSSLDVFGLYNFDNADDLRWGHSYQRFSSLCSRFPNDEGNQDDYGYGAIWSSKFAKNLPYQVFAMQKRMRNVESGRNHTELVGAKLTPKWNDGLSSAFEVMSELNSEWSAYADLAWKSSADGVKPFFKLGYHFMSKEWDPMWARAVNDSEMFLYGTHNGVAWWSNMHLLKLTAGLDFGAFHALTFSTGPMFAAEADGIGGGNGYFKGELSQVKYGFPLIVPDKGDRFEAHAHVLFEYFNPGDYYESSKGAWSFRWQIEFKF